MRRTVGLLLVVGLALALMSMGAEEEPSWTGRLAVVGNVPFAYLALTDASGRQWRLKGEAVVVLEREGQGRMVRITGHVEGRDGIVVRSWAWVPDEETM